MANNSAVTLSDAFNAVFNTLSLNSLNLNSAFFCILFAITLFSVYSHFSGRWSKFVSVAPTMLTGIGILGTFLGILVGLGDAFHGSEGATVDEKLGILVKAMQFAFVTSVIGMFFALAVRILSFIPNSKTTEETPRTAEDFLSLVQSIKDSLDKASTKNNNNFAEVIKAIAGDDDFTLASQIKLLRSEENNNHEKLRNEFSKFAKKMSENNSKSLIQALEGVMRDFNAKINEQFGDNFKELNKAVGSLLQWQENYKEQIITMEKRFKRCIESIAEVEKAMTFIKESTDAIPETMGKLPEIVNVTTDSLQAFADMKEQAITAFPIIEDNLQKLTANLENQVKSFETALIAQKGSYENLETSFAGLSNKSKSVMEGLNAQMKGTMEAQQKQMKEITEEFSIQMQGAIKKSVDNSIGELRELFSGFNGQMEEQLKSVLENMGSHLASLSQKFVDDYTPLTTKLQELVNMTKGVDNENR